MPKYLYVSRNGINQLEAVDLETENVIGKLKEGETLKLTYKKVRNGTYHSKFFSMINLVFENQDKYDVMEDFLTEVKLRSGHYKTHVTLKGKMIYIPKSIAFDEMDQFDFEKFYEKAINVCLKHFVAIDNQTLIDAVCRY